MNNSSAVELGKVLMTEQPVAVDPYPFFTKLQAEQGPVWSSVHNAWLISHHEHVKEMLGSPLASTQKMDPFMARMTGDTRAKLDRLNEVLRHWIIFNDPPEHTRIRKALQKVFMPRDLRSFEGRVREIVVDLFNSLKGRTEFDFITDFALDLPAVLICELFGIPNSDAPRMTRWGHGIAKFVMGSTSKSRYDNALADMEEMRSYFVDLVRNYDPSSPEAGDTLLRRLMSSRDLPDGLTTDEIIATLVLVLFAGLDTTANALGNMVLTLLRNQELLSALAADPALASEVVEELLRFETPAPLVTRVAKEDFELGGVLIRKSQRMIILIASANRDARLFDEPDRFRVDRDACPHLSFGRGVHFCLGAPLARMELRVVLEELVTLDQRWEIATDDLKWRDELLVRGLVSLPIRVLDK